MVSFYCSFMANFSFRFAFARSSALNSTERLETPQGAKVNKHRTKKNELVIATENNMVEHDLTYIYYIV